MLVRTMARTLEMVNGAEALFELKGLNKTQDDQQHRDDDQYVCVRAKPFSAQMSVMIALIMVITSSPSVLSFR